MSQKKGTIILDSRSAAAFKASHIKSAININFSDFTQEKLAKFIPDKNTRILIYCNNNFKVSKGDDTSSERLQIQPKSAPLALNIPTFINLYGYGYKNVYELSSTLEPKDPRANLVGDYLKK